MKTNIKLIAALVIALCVNPSAFAKEPSAQAKADAAVINTACVQDAATAGCAGQVVGKGLLRCMSNYKKANVSFKHTPGCRAAMKQLHLDKKSGK